MQVVANEFATMRKRHVKATRSTNDALDAMASILDSLNATLQPPSTQVDTSSPSAGNTIQPQQQATTQPPSDPMVVEPSAQQASAASASQQSTPLELLQKMRASCRSLQSALVSDHRSVGASMNKLGRSIDSATAPNLGDLCASSVRLQTAKINDAIAAHLFREGLFDVGRTFLRESHVVLDADNIRPFEQLYNILTAFRQDDLGPAIAWTTENRESLCGSSSDLGFRLHRLAYLQILQRGDRNGALMYARKHFSAFPEHIAAVQKLMTCLLYAPDLSVSPYADLVNPTHRDEIERCISREYCRAQGLSRDSMLLTVIRCGTQAIPTLIKAARIAPNLRELGMDDTLPVEVDVGRECQFHSIFTCPVSKEEASESNNMPMILPCGHVLSKQSISRLPRGSTRFKCPYCPVEMAVSDCHELYF